MREDAPGVEVGDRRAPWQGPVKTEAPSRAPTPPEEWQRQASALDRYELLFTDEGAALEKALATVEGPPPGEPFADVPWDLYTPFAKMVLEAGYDFAVAEDGRVSIQEVERAEHSFDAVEILRRAQAIEWKDEELLDALAWGTTDHSEPTPRVCILARATKGAMVHADVFERKVVEETGKGFVTRRAKPFGVPTVSRGTNVIPKEEALEGQEQRYRCIVNRSDGNDGYVFDGKQFLPAAPNANTAKLELPDLRWASIQTLEWCGRFVDGGGRLCFHPQRFLRWLYGRNQRRARHVPRPVGEAFTDVRTAIESGRTRPFIADPVWGHPGDAVASDASTAVGWGIVVGGVILYGLWEAETIAAFEATAGRVAATRDHAEIPEAPYGGAVGDAGEEIADKDVEGGPGGVELASISPAELLVTGYTVRTVREIGVAPANGQFYSRCDNDSAVRVVNAGRARSPAMTEALRVVHEEEIGAPGERRLRMRLEHIGTLENKVADLLSRGDIEEAIAMVTTRWGSCEVRTLDEVFLRSTEKRVREATLHEYDGWE